VYGKGDLSLRDYTKIAPIQSSHDYPIMTDTDSTLSQMAKLHMNATVTPVQPLRREQIMDSITWITL
jgi:hypothetical protein